MKRIYSLDILKFIMSILIVYYHYLQITGTTDIMYIYSGSYLMLGYLVELFFIISGFLIAGSLGKISEMDFKDYIVGKILRIYPIAILSVCFSAIVGFIYYKLYNEFFFDIPITLWKMLTSVLFINSGGMLRPGFGINSPLWYLGVLMYCYVITYFIVWFSNKIKVRSMYFFIGMVCFGLSVIQYEIELPFMNLMTGRGYTSFFLGIILYYIWRSLSHSKLTIYSVLCILLCACTYYFERDLYLDGQREVLNYLLFPAILFLTLAVDERFDLSFVRSLKFGELSYDIYVWHYCVISLIMLLNRRYDFMSGNEYRILLICILSVIALSIIMNKCVEKKITGYLMGKYSGNTILNSTK